MGPVGYVFISVSAPFVVLIVEQKLEEKNINIIPIWSVGYAPFTFLRFFISSQRVSAYKKKSKLKLNMTFLINLIFER
jgi:hypothetical protein